MSSITWNEFSRLFSRIYTQGTCISSTENECIDTSTQLHEPVDELQF